MKPPDPTRPEDATTKRGFGKKAALGLGILATIVATAPLLAERAPSATRKINDPTLASVRPPLRVRVVPVRRGNIERGGEVTGVVSAFRKSTIASETASRVVKRSTESGDRVEAGTALLTLDATRHSLAVDEARANLEARRVDLAEAKQELTRGEELARSNTIALSRHDTLRFGVDRAKTQLSLARVSLASAERALEDANIKAPFSGSIEEVFVDVGDYLRPGTPVAVMVDLSRVRLRAGVTAAEARGLRAGAEVTAVFEDLGGRELRGKIRSVGQLADPGTGTYTVEIWVDNPGSDLRDGMVARVLLPSAEQDPQPVVPRAALIRRQGLISLFVVEGGIAHARAIRVGRSSKDLVEILEGAELGDAVVVDGLFALRDGAAVSIEAAPEVQ